MKRVRKSHVPVVVAAVVDSVAAVDAVPAESAIAGKRDKSASFKKGVPSHDGTPFIFVELLNFAHTLGEFADEANQSNHSSAPFTPPALSFSSDSGVGGGVCMVSFTRDTNA